MPGSSFTSVLVVGLQLMDLFSKAYGQDAPLFVQGALMVLPPLTTLSIPEVL